MAYDVVQVIHVIAVLLAFGPTFAYPFMQVRAEKHEPAAVPYLWRVQQRIDRIFVIPGMLIVFAGGLYMALSQGVIAAPWVSAGMLILIVLLVLVAFVLHPAERRAMQLAERDLAQGGGGALSDEYWKVSRRLAMFGGIASLLVLIAVVLMVTKPGG